jgi:hypothetical protein
LYFQRVVGASVPESYEERLTEIFEGEFTRLHLFALDPYDLALSKLSRNSEVDREDVRYLAKHVPLDPQLLQRRYDHELRPIILGNQAEHDLTVKMWIAAYFSSER